MDRAFNVFVWIVLPLSKYFINTVNIKVLISGVDKSRNSSVISQFMSYNAREGVVGSPTTSEAQK